MATDDKTTDGLPIKLVAAYAKMDKARQDAVMREIAAAPTEAAVITILKDVIDHGG